MRKVRINKFLADSGVSSRRKSEEYIIENRVAVNDNIITDLSFKVDDEKDIITKYLELLSSGGNDYPINQLKKCGVDMTTADPFEATLKLFSEQVDDVERLAL